MSKHTPGPWEVWEGHFGIFAGVTVNEHSHIVADTDICELPDPDEWEGGSTAQLSANARLIAAAPELLEAVQALGVMPEGYCFCRQNRVGDDSKTHEPECRDLRAAIAKAEGTTTKEKK